MEPKHMIESSLRTRLLSLIANAAHSDQRSAYDVISWIRNCEMPYRIQKPNIPNRHLAAYAIMRDRASFLMVNHARARTWLPVGGHLEPGELPESALRRELLEELGITPQGIVPIPFYVTSRTVVDGLATHTDVTFWHLVEVERREIGMQTIDNQEELRWMAEDILLRLPDRVGLRLALRRLAILEGRKFSRRGKKGRGAVTPVGSLI